MPRVGFELTIPAFERAKTVLALNCAATVIGSYAHITSSKPLKKQLSSNEQCEYFKMELLRRQEILKDQMAVELSTTWFFSLIPAGRRNIWASDGLVRASRFIFFDHKKFPPPAQIPPEQIPVSCTDLDFLLQTSWFLYHEMIGNKTAKSRIHSQVADILCAVKQTATN
jgi:hypothetical protein